MREIILTKGTRTQVDDDDYEYLNQFKWNLLRTKNGRYARRGEGKYKRIMMHREIMQTPPDLQVDHIDHNGLNNQRYNLRNCTAKENIRHNNPYGISQYKGVNIIKRKHRTLIAARINNRHIGYFKTEKEAAIAYNEIAKELFGEFAYINEI